MKKAFVICLIYLLAYQTIYAQSATSKQFNELKRSQKYFYSEATLPSRDDAKIVALANLLKLINDSLKATTNDTAIELADLEGKVLYLEMSREGGARVLAYVDKSDYLKGNTANEVNNDSPPSAPLTRETVDEVSLPNDVETVASLQEQHGDMAMENEWISNSINILMKKQSLTDFCDELSIMNGQHKIKRYSSLQQRKNVQDSYVAIFDSNDCLMALLGPLTSSRYNFMTRSEDTLEKYQTQSDISIICFQFSK